MDDVIVICRICESDVCYLERIPLHGEPFIFYLRDTLSQDKFIFYASHNSYCGFCGTRVLIPWQGQGYKVLTSRGLIPATGNKGILNDSQKT